MRARLQLVFGACVTCIFLCVLTSLWANISSYYNEVALKELAQRLDVAPTFTDVARYVDRIIEDGMSREEVEVTLSQIAPLEVTHRGKLTTRGGLEPYVCDDLLLQVGPFNANLSFSACYYGEGKALFNFEYKSS